MASDDGSGQRLNRSRRSRRVLLRKRHRRDGQLDLSECRAVELGQVPDPNVAIGLDLEPTAERLHRAEHAAAIDKAIFPGLQGGPLDIRDKYSFDMPPITSAEDWEQLRDAFLGNAETFIAATVSEPTMPSAANP